MKALVPTILILFTTPVYAAGFWDLCNQPSISISSHSPSKDLLLSGLCPNSQGAYIHSAVFLQECFVNVNGTLFDKQRYISPTPAEYEKAKQEIGKERRKKQFRDDCQDCRLNIIHGLKTQWETEAEVPMMACMCRIVSMDGEVGWSEAKVDLGMYTFLSNSLLYPLMLRYEQRPWCKTGTAISPAFARMLGRYWMEQAKMES
jgi:hypothetical protein